MSANISILGNAGRDVSLRYAENGTAIASFPIASNSFKKTSEGRVEVTHWFNVIAFGKTAETIAEYVKKGSCLLVHGRLSFNPWTTNEGEARSGADVALVSFEFASEKRPEGTEAITAAPEKTEPATPEYTGPLNAETQGSEPFVNQF
ncbi:MAG: single-stranded DNA-binding protein [Pyrinomonadaceae bacterium]